MGFIQINYSKAINLANELEMAADRCSQANKDLRKELKNSEAFWKGNAGNAMRSQTEMMAKDLKTTEGKMRSIAANIRRVATELREKDFEVASRIKGGGGGGGHGF